MQKYGECEKGPSSTQEQYPRRSPRCPLQAYPAALAQASNTSLGALPGRLQVQQAGRFQQARYADGVRDAAVHNQLHGLRQREFPEA
ncbi:hypothetical protein GCM10011378_34590 [Hymenobacter glacieicola]|uniref:Uncharacterized protein n=1 Tax=Hymenobacter glacieicola TaxID=1562124 RepID=A0ABQ1X4J9_9BACT|nr:hypothetical protein GCM10011378_34590 [Hymenobacter glacieicola]